MLEKTLESPLDCKEIQPVHPKGNQSWIFIGRTDAEAETPILQPPDVKNALTGKDPDAGKDWRWEEKGAREDKMVGWHHQLNGPEFEQAPGVGDEQGSLACCSPWDREELVTTEWVNWTDGIRDDRTIYSPSPIVRSQSFRKPVFLACELHTHFSISLPSGGAGWLEWTEVIHFPSSTFKTGAVIVGYFPSPTSVKLW